MAMYTSEQANRAASHNELRVMADVPRFHARRNPDKVAMIFNDRQTAYDEFDLHTTQMANGMLAEGLQAQARIAYLDVNTDHFFSLLFACGKADMVMCSVNWRLAPPEVEYIINDAQAGLLFVGERFFGIVEQILPSLKTVSKVITLSGHHPHWESIESWRDRQSEIDPDLPIDEDHIAIQMYTSGTTGHPKGVQISHRALFATSVDDRDDIEWNVWTPDDVSLVAMPTFHVGGSRWGIMGLIPGCLNIILPEFEPSKVLAAIQKYKVSKLFMVPAAMQFILQLPNAREVNYDSIKYMLYGASPIPLTVLQQAIDVFQCGFVQLYGMTETAGSATYLPPQDHTVEGNKRMKSAGKALPFVEICIRDENGQIVPPHTVGEICIKSPANMTGYWNLPEATAKTLKDGWVYTGDAGYMDEDGYVYVHDRIKDMIVTGGENVYPAEVEAALFAHPAVADCAVIGIPDEKWGEAVKACVVLKPDAKATADELIVFARGRIAGFKVPKSIDFMAVLPRNPSGKLLKRELRAPYWEGRERQVN